MVRRSARPGPGAQSGRTGGSVRNGSMLGPERTRYFQAGAIQTALAAATKVPSTS